MARLLRTFAHLPSAGHRRLILLSLMLLFSMVSPACFAAEIPLDEPGFTKALAKAFRKAMPGTKVTVLGPLTLEVRPPNGDKSQAPLDAIYGFCVRNPADCEAGVQVHVARMSATFGHENAAPDRKLLRALVRPSGYVDAIRKAYAGKEEPPIAPFVGDLWIICALDMPEAIKMLAPGDLAKLGLSREEALALAKKNDAEMFEPIKQVARAIPGDGVGVVANNPYDSSRLLALDSWAPIAAETGGQLLAAAPSANAVIFIDGRRANAMEIMRRSAAMIASKAARPFVPQIFKWTPAGWILVGQ